MKKIGLFFIVTTLFTINNSFTQSTPNSLLKSNKQSEKIQSIERKAIDKSPEIVEFILKYKGNDKTPTQKELNELGLNIGITEINSNKTISKEVVFKLIDFYFKYSEENNPLDLANFDNENRVFKSLSYVNFRKQIKGVNPNATDTEIQQIYVEMHEKLKNI